MAEGRLRGAGPSAFFFWIAAEAAEKKRRFEGKRGLSSRRFSNAGVRGFSAGL